MRQKINIEFQHTSKHTARILQLTDTNCTVNALITQSIHDIQESASLLSVSCVWEVPSGNQKEGVAGSERNVTPPVHIPPQIMGEI